MDKKISLDIAKQHYYISIPSGHQQKMFSSVFAYDVLLETVQNISGVALYGYALFPDHIHLLVYSESKPSVWLESCLMHYNQWHQDTTGETVYLFDDEHLSTVLVQPKYLCKTLRHLHYLPIFNRQCSAPDQFSYSSYHDYMNDQQTGVECPPILSILSPHFGQRIRRFQDYMAVPNQELAPYFQYGAHDYYLAIADNAYLTQVRSQYQGAIQEIPESEHIKTWKRCIDHLISQQGFDTEIWIGIHRHHSQPDAHFILAWMFVRVANGPTYVAAKQLGIDESTLKLKINSIHLHHPARYLRYIEQSWNPIAV